MIKKCVISAIILSTICSFKASPCLAEDFSIVSIPLEKPQKNSEVLINLTPVKNQVHELSLSENDTFYHLMEATDKFVQCNVGASWSDFKDIINKAEQNDFIYLSIASKMADMGLFDLAGLAVSKVQDKEISKNPVDEMKRFYFPRKKLKIDDELSLAEVYSSIIYNDQSSESANELLKNSTILSNSDYANYLLALASYKSNFYSRANQYIEIAVLQNPSNLNYQKLKAQILAESKNPTDALKVVEFLKKQNLASYEYNRQVKSLEQYVLHKTKKAEWEKNYHLGYYYYLENDGSKGIRTLQTALSQARKRGNTEAIYGLMSEIYMSMNEFEKASDTAKKAYKVNKNDAKALVTLGDLSFRTKNYKQALKYYKQAANCDKISYKPLVKEAQTYQMISNDKKAKEIYTKILKTNSDCFEAYYNIALMHKESPDEEMIYVKKALSANLLFKDGWIELAKISISRDNYDTAQKYLSNAYYIDENDCRYYYYQGLVDKNTGDATKAEYNFKKALKLNPSYKEARQELSAGSL